MKRLYAPWRSTYTDTEVRTKKTDATENECVFCVQTGTQNPEMKKKHQILYYGKTGVLMMNKYPYNAGHMLAVPYAHQAHLHMLTNTQRHELFDLVSQASHIAQDTLKAEGINVGLSLGKAAGAGIPAHLHAHIIPRWTGDTNFLVTSADIKTISHDLNKIYEQLRDACAHIMREKKPVS